MTALGRLLPRFAKGPWSGPDCDGRYVLLVWGRLVVEINFGRKDRVL